MKLLVHRSSFPYLLREIKGLPTLLYTRISLMGNTVFEQKAALPPLHTTCFPLSLRYSFPFLKIQCKYYILL